jgi:transposase
MTPAAVPVTLTAAERMTLKKRVRGAKTPYRDRLRAQIVLAAARGRDNERIAADLGVSVNTVRKWRGRLAERRLAGLKDLPRSGRPRRISEADRAAAVALACQLPAQTGVPLSRWTGPELAAELLAQGLVSEPMAVSRSSRRKSSPRTISPAWSSYPKPCSPSSAATTRPRSRSAGNTPPPTSPACSTASANTTSKTPGRKPPSRQQHENPQRTYGFSHLASGRRP